MKKVVVVIEKTLEEWWATDEEFADMTDKEIVELLQEDLSALLDGASWTVKR